MEHSIVIITYNQVDFVKDSIISALQQDFTNYEIIISDDKSQDNTWEKIKEIVYGYDTSIKCILNRNEKNLGIVKNLEKALSLTSGEWITILAGDDILKPNRLNTINELKNYEDKILAIGTGYDIINKKGETLSTNNKCIQKELKIPLYPGFSASINRELIKNKPKIQENLNSEDIIFTLRALEKGKILLTNKSTIKHRIHDNNITSKGYSKDSYYGKIKNLKNAIKTLKYYEEKELQNIKLKEPITKQEERFVDLIDFYMIMIDIYDVNIIKQYLKLKKMKYNKLQSIKELLKKQSVFRYLNYKIKQIYSRLKANEIIEIKTYKTI